NLASPRATAVGTHLRSPLMVGNPGEGGIALLTKRASLQASVGDFSGFLVKFPTGSVLLNIYVSIITPFNGTTPTLSFGKTASGTEFGGPVDLTQTSRTVAIPVTALVAPTYSLFMSAALGGATTGEAAIAMVYSGLPLKAWQ